MPSKIQLYVPPRHRAALNALATMDEQGWTDLLSQLRVAPEPWDSDRAEESISVTGLDHPGALVDALFSLEGVRAAHSWRRQELASAVAAAKELEVSPRERPQFASRLLEIMTIGPILRAAKASDLIESHPCVLHTGRVITDVRPVFDDEVQAAPVGSVIMQQLELTVIEAGQEKSIFISATDAGLERLQSQIERALQKSAVMRDFLANAEIPVHTYTGAE